LKKIATHFKLVETYLFFYSEAFKYSFVFRKITFLFPSLPVNDFADIGFLVGQKKYCTSLIKQE